MVEHPEDYGTSFWASLPHGTFYPMWILATLAAIIASQALISAAFQIVKQAIAQGFFPRFTIIHTSKKVPMDFSALFKCCALEDEYCPILQASEHALVVTCPFFGNKRL